MEGFNNETYDDVVVGAGIIGSWTAYHLVKQGRKVLLLDQFPLPHTRGSSHGHSRMMKQSHRKPAYSNLIPESLEWWHRLEKESGEKLVLNTGCLTICEKRTNTQLFNQLTGYMLKGGVKHTTYQTGSQINEAFPGTNFNEDYTGYFEENGAVLKADKCLRNLHMLFTNHGGVLKESQLVEKVIPVKDDLVRLKTSQNHFYSAKHVVLACGTWINKVLRSVGLNLPVKATKVTTQYWRQREPELNPDKPKIPPLIFYFSKYHLYSISSFEYPGLVKMCYHYRTTVDPDSRDVALSADQVKEDESRFEYLKEIIRKHFPFLEPEPSVQEACLQAITPNSDFILDRHPLHNNIVVASGGSGHAFGPAPVLGKILSCLVTNKDTDYPMKPFRIANSAAGFNSNL